MTSSLLLAAFMSVADTCAVAVEFRVPSPLGHQLSVLLESRDPTRRLPTVILISGAGADDRNAYTLATSRGTNGAFQSLSGRLTSRGFAVVRFDEMGTGRSTGDYRRYATTETLARDVTAIVAALRGRTDVDHARVVLLGYSEGGAIAGIVGAGDALISGIVLLAAPAWEGARIMRYLDSIALADPYLADEGARARVRARLDSTATARRETEAWYPYFLRYDPSPAYERLRMPVLIIQGVNDRRVAAGQAAEIAKRLRVAGNARAQLELMPDLGHALTDSEWNQSPSPLSPRVLSTIEAWLGRTQAAGAGTPSCRARH